MGTNLKDFFSDDTDEKIVFNLEDAFEVIDSKMKYKVEWIIPNAQKNQMEPILLTLEEGGRYKEEIAHDGQEFGYILEGEINIHLGEKFSMLKKENLFTITLVKTIIFLTVVKVLLKFFGLLLPLLLIK